MAARRYWKFQLLGPGNFAYALAEARIRETSGGSNITPAAVTASSVYSGAPTQTVDKLFDGSTSTYWAANLPAPQWFKADLGAGVAKDIVEFALVCRGDGGQGGADQAPDGVLVSSSPDDSTYTDEWIGLCGVPWSAGQTQTFTKPTAAASRYWGILFPPGGFIPRAAEFALRNGAGSNLLIGATASASRGTASAANDGVTSSGGWVGTSNRGSWWLADLGAGNAQPVAQYWENTAGNIDGQSLQDFYVVRGDTARGMQIVGHFTSATAPTAFQTQQFTLSGYAGASARRRRVFVVG